ncbi:hypothetical protein D3C81_357980 [compost metagenome]
MGSLSAAVRLRPASRMGKPPGSLAGCRLVMAGVLTVSKSKVRRKMPGATLTIAVVPSRMSTVTGLPSTRIQPPGFTSPVSMMTGAESPRPRPFV